MKAKRAFRFILLVLIVFTSLGSARYTDCAFESVPAGARPLGMGSVYVSVADDAGAIFWNPAGIARIDRQELAVSYMELYNLISYSFISYVHRIKGTPVGLGLVSSSDTDGIYREIELALSYALNVRKNLCAGANAKYLSVSADVGDVNVGTGKGLSLDLGCQYRLFNELVSLGFVLQNLIGYVSYNRETVMGIPGQRYSQRPDFTYKVGADINLPRLFVRWHKRLIHPADDAVMAFEISDGNLHVGAEYAFRDFVSIRSGFRIGNALNRALTAGLGIKLSTLRLDYAYIGSEVGAQTSQFSVSVSW